MGYKYLAVAVTNLETSVSFYSKVGFFLSLVSNPRCHVLNNLGGCGIHLFQTNRNLPDGKNILQDLGDDGEKYPGHTHMSFGVQCVSKTKEYFETKCGIPLSGTRGALAVFIRDPDRTTLEFERNDGGDPSKDESVDPSTYDPNINPEVISQVPRGGVDHVGTRVSDPPTNIVWYQKALGMTKTVMTYDIDPVNIRKNGRPWIIRTETGSTEKTPIYEAHYSRASPAELMNEYDENLIPNATIAGVNIMLSPGEDPLPGIVYLAIEVDDIQQYKEKYLQMFGDDGSLIDEDKCELWGIPRDMVVPMAAPSVFVRDPDQSVFRIIGK